MKNYVQPGKVIDFTAGAILTSGQPVLIGTRLAICVSSYASGAAAEGNVEGVYTVTKATTDVVAQGAALYWDDTAKNLTTTATNNTLVAWAFKAAGNGDTTVAAKLLP